MLRVSYFMILIVGLGNPGKKYQNTRHNIGTRTADAVCANFQFPNYKFQTNFKSEISKGEIDGEQVVLAKPQTFMNLSGAAVKKLFGNWSAGRRIEIGNLIVVHDDIDLPLGRIKISQGSGSAGHKGVQSIIDTLGSKDFIRLRIGIQPKSGKPARAEDFVLKKFTKSEEKILKDVIEKSVAAIEMIIREGLDKAMNEYN